MNRLAATVAAACFLPAVAWAACPGSGTVSLTIKDGAGVSQLMCVGNDGGSNYFQRISVVDGTAGANVLAVGASGTLAVTQSGTWNIGTVTTLPALVAGSALIGKVGIDQTTPGTTNAVQVTNFQTGLTATTTQGSVALDVAVKSAPPSLAQERGGNLDTLAGTVRFGKTNVNLASLGGGIILPISGTLTAGTAIIGKVGIDQTTPGTTNAVQITNIPTGLTATSTPGVSGTGLDVAVKSMPPGLALERGGNLDRLASTVNFHRVDVNLRSVAGSLVLSTKITDGINSGAVKAASANALLTDPSQVVTPSPNPSTVCTSVVAVNQTGSTDILTSVNKLHVCTVILIAAGQEQVSVVEGTGSVCGSNTVALLGATTADGTHGIPFAANGGFSAAAERAWMVTQTAGDHLCILKSGANLLSGAIWYVDHT